MPVIVNNQIDVLVLKLHTKCGGGGGYSRAEKSDEGAKNRERENSLHNSLSGSYATAFNIKP